MQAGKVESAERRALNLFDDWNNITGFVLIHTSYYYELQGVIKDAVHCGIQQALNDIKPLSDKEINHANKNNSGHSAFSL